MWILQYRFTVEDFPIWTSNQIIESEYLLFYRIKELRDIDQYIWHMHRFGVIFGALVLVYHPVKNITDILCFSETNDLDLG